MLDDGATTVAPPPRSRSATASLPPKPNFAASRERRSRVEKVVPVEGVTVNEDAPVQGAPREDGGTQAGVQGCEGPGLGSGVSDASQKAGHDNQSEDQGLGKAKDDEGEGNECGDGSDFENRSDLGSEFEIQNSMEVENEVENESETASVTGSAADDEDEASVIGSVTDTETVADRDDTGTASPPVSPPVSPLSSADELFGASRTTGGKFRGKAMGNAYNMADLGMYFFLKQENIFKQIYRCRNCK
jgi:hypothetical protein